MAEERASELRRNRKNRRYSFLFGFLLVVLVAAMFAVTFMLQVQHSELADQKLEATIDEINEILLPALEANLEKIDDKIDALMRADELLKDNCTDIRMLLVPKLGRSVLTPIPRLSHPRLAEEPAERLPRLKLPRYQ